MKHVGTGGSSMGACACTGAAVAGVESDSANNRPAVSSTLPGSVFPNWWACSLVVMTMSS